MSRSCSEVVEGVEVVEVIEELRSPPAVTSSSSKTSTP